MSPSGAIPLLAALVIVNWQEAVHGPAADSILVVTTHVGAQVCAESFLILGLHGGCCQTREIDALQRGDATTIRNLKTFWLEPLSSVKDFGWHPQSARPPPLPRDAAPAGISHRKSH
jgi:hypothetical protein